MQKLLNKAICISKSLLSERLLSSDWSDGQSVLIGRSLSPHVRI